MRLLLSLAVLAAPAAFADDKPAGEWKPMFDGKTLDGWTPKIKGYALGDNFGDTFKVTDGKMVVGYEKYDAFDNKFGHIFHKEKYSHYRVRVEYRFVGEQCKGGPGWAIRNSGLMLHGQTPETMRKDQEFPVSIEVQLLGGNGKDPRTTANMCSPGTNIVLADKLFTTHCTNSVSKTFAGDQWVTVEVEVNGSGKIKHFINGEQVMEYEQPQLDPKDKDAAKILEKAKEKLLSEGTISLQSESHPVEFRKVEIKQLKK